MKIKAAVLYEPNTPLVIEEVELDEPKEGEVLVRTVGAGVCYSDYHVMIGEWTMPLPMVLGHEAAGVVERIGPGVKRVKPGDHVVASFRANCGHCRYCTVGRPVLCNGPKSNRWFMFDGTTRLRKGSQHIHHFSRVACFGEYMVLPESGAVPVREDMPLEKAALIGCAVMTGVGAVTNTARVEAGSTVLVVGCGGVGLNVVQGAALAGASRIIGVDILQNKLTYAREVGATDTLLQSDGDVVERVIDMTDGGVDYAFEAIGNPDCIRQCYEATGPGGTTIIVGMAEENAEVRFNALSMPRSERGIIGSWYGSARPWFDFPILVDHYMEGRLKLDEIISRTWCLDEINEAYQSLARGDLARSIIVFD